MTEEDEEFNRIERESDMRTKAVSAALTAHATHLTEYVKGFNDGYAYVLTQIERHPEMTATELLQYLKGDVEQKSQASCGGIVVA